MADKRQAKQSGGASAPSLSGEPAPRAIPDLPIGESVVKAKPVEPLPQIGDVVVYSHRRTRSGYDGKDYIDLPMIVTRVTDPSTVSGVVFSDSTAYCQNGAKAVIDAKLGQGGGTWRPHP